MRLGWPWALLLAAGCTFEPDLSRFPACEEGRCPAGWSCLAQVGRCLPDCGERGPCGAGADAGVGEAPWLAGPLMLAEAPVGEPYAERLSAVGGVPPYRFSLAAGSVLPAGLSLAEDGLVTGSAQRTGTTTFEVRVSDSSTPAQQSTRVLSVTAIAPAALLRMTTRAVPDGRTGRAYTYALRYAGGTGAVRWALEGGTLPPGLALEPASGLLSGTPAQAGTSTFTLTASDLLVTDRRTLSLRVE